MTQQIQTPGQPAAPYGPTPPPYGQQPVYGPPSAPYAQQFPPAGPPLGPSGYGQPPVPARPRRRTGLIIGIVVGVVVLAGLGVGALFLFGSKTLDTAAAQTQIAKITEQQIGTTPTDVHCPSGITVAAGKTFTCTGTLDGQPVSYTVKETDDKGNVHIDSDNPFVQVAKVEAGLEQQVGQQAEIDVTATCDTGGKKILVDGVDKPISCTVTNADDPTDSLDVTATVDQEGAVSWTS